MHVLVTFRCILDDFCSSYVVCALYYITIKITRNQFSGLFVIANGIDNLESSMIGFTVLLSVLVVYQILRVFVT